MLRGLAQGLLLMLLVITSSGELWGAPVMTNREGGLAERSLSLLQQIDLSALPPAERQKLLLGVAEQQVAAGQVEQALPLLASALNQGEALTPPLHDLLKRLVSRLDPPHLATLLASLADSPGAALLQPVLAERRAIQQQPTIAVLLPLSGRYAPFGDMVRRGIDLAHATSPAAGGVRFRFLDTAGDGAMAARLVSELAADPAVQAVIGPLTSGEAEPATVQAADLKLPLLLLAPREGTTGSAHGVFRQALTTRAQVRAVAEHTVQSRGLRRFAVFYPATRQGEEYADLLQAEVTRLAGQLVGRQSYPPETVDLREDLQKLANLIRAAGGAEALFLPDDPRQVGQIAPQLGFARLDQLQLLGIASWHTPELPRLAGPLLEGALFASGFCSDRAAAPVAPFVETFRARYGSEPTAFDAIGFDSATLLLSVLADPGVYDRQTLVQALATLRDYPGVTGPLRFAATGEAEKSLCLLQVRGGALLTLN
jgi:ABC-type branched-subunit amino acid transport system substrate-binding protein